MWPQNKANRNIQTWAILFFNTTMIFHMSDWYTQGLCQGLCLKDQDKDKNQDLNLVLKESLRTRTKDKDNITGSRPSQVIGGAVRTVQYINCSCLPACVSAYASAVNRRVGSISPSSVQVLQLWRVGTLSGTEETGRHRIAILVLIESSGRSLTIVNQP